MQLIFEKRSLFKIFSVKVNKFQHFQTKLPKTPYCMIYIYVGKRMSRNIHFTKILQKIKRRIYGMKLLFSLVIK